MRRIRLALALAAMAFSPLLLSAQTTGDISGKVTDEQGGPLPGVTDRGPQPGLPGRAHGRSRTPRGATA